MTTPPAYLGLDLWQALGLPVGEFDGYLARNGWADTWAALIRAVKVQRGVPACGLPDDEGNPCVLLAHDPNFPHYAAGDVGRTEPLPPARSTR